MPGKGGMVCCVKGRVPVSWPNTHGALHGALQFSLKHIFYTIHRAECGRV